MTSYSIWEGAAVPGTLFSGVFTLGTIFILDEDCTLTTVSFYSKSGAQALPTSAVLWNVGTEAEVPGTLDTSPAWSGAIASGWVNDTNYDDTVTLTAGTYYAVSVFYGGALLWFTGDSGGFTGDIVNGPITAPDNADSPANAQQAPYAAGSLAFPTLVLADWFFGVDVTVTPVAGGVSGTISMALAPMTLGKTGSETVPGMTGMALAPMRLALTGSERVPGSAAMAMAPMRLALTGSEAMAGSMAAALAPMRLALTGAVVGQHVTGSLDMALAPMGLQLAAAETMPGSLAAALAPMKLSATGAETMPGSASLAFAPMRLDATAQQVGQGVTGNMTMAMAPMKFTGGISGKITQAQGAAHVIAVPLELLIQGAPRTGGQEPWAA